MKKYLLIFAAGYLFMNFAGVPVFAQCGSEGLDRCCGNPARACKRGDKPAVAYANLNVVAEADVRMRSQIVNAQRQDYERRRARRKQLARVNVSDNAKMMKTITSDLKIKTLNLFPVEGFVPGEKQSTYFSPMLDNECGRIETGAEMSKCYVTNGIHFYFDGDGTSDHLYVNRFRPDINNLRSDGMPDKWRAYGFNWDASYNDWIKLFKKLGYPTLTTEKPSIRLRDGSKFFDAEMMTLVKTPNGVMQITLNFTNGFGKTTADDKGTLFSIVVDKLG